MIHPLFPTWRRSAWGAALAAALALTGCATAPPPTVSWTPPPWRDDAFVASAEPAQAAQLFVVTDEMRRYLRVELGKDVRADGPLRGLYRALQAPGRLRLDYDSRSTRTAAQAFEDRAGNCLSLVILSAALARELDLKTSFQQVMGEASWSLAGDMLVVNDHINLVLGSSNPGSSWSVDSGMALIVDFLPSEVMRGARTRAISEHTVITMFMNNRAVEALLDGRVDAAYAWARSALQREPGFTPALNTLGVLYQKRGLLPEAAQVFTLALQQTPDSASTLSNLAGVQRSLGQTDQAQATEARLAQLRQTAPWSEFRQAQAAMRRGQYEQARTLLRQAAARDPNQRDVHVWLAQAELSLGNHQAAEQQLSLAISHSPTDERPLYSAKLEKLRAAYATR
jgi:Tfp pilus assembly protein PilF